MLDQKYYNRFHNYWEHDINSDCWLWTGATTTRGHGQMTIRYSGMSYVPTASRLSYMLHNCLVPPDIEGQLVIHNCNKKICVNPDHLRLGTEADNHRDAVVDMVNPLQKLSVDDAREIRELWATGEYTQSELANAYGVAQSSISNVVRNVTFKDF
jgi:hypothetical protein